MVRIISVVSANGWKRAPSDERNGRANVRRAPQIQQQQNRWFKMRANVHVKSIIRCMQPAFKARTHTHTYTHWAQPWTEKSSVCGVRARTFFLSIWRNAVERFPFALALHSLYLSHSLLFATHVCAFKSLNLYRWNLIQSKYKTRVQRIREL